MKVDEIIYIILLSLFLIWIIAHIFSYLRKILYKKKLSEYEKLLDINIITSYDVNKYEMIKKTKKFFISLLTSIVIICCIIFFGGSSVETKLIITGIAFFIIPCFSKPQTENAIYGEMFAMLWVGLLFGWWIFA